MIDREVFAQRMALLAGRIGRELEAPVLREYYMHLSQALTTERFVAATALAFKTWSAEYRNWPSPQQLIELITPVAAPGLSALEAFEQVLAIMHPHRSHADMRLQVQACGAAALRAFNAAGGFREFNGVLADDLPWLRRRFVETYEAATENADAERAATLALESVDARVRGLVEDVAAKRVVPGAPTSTPVARQRAIPGVRS